MSDPDNAIPLPPFETWVPSGNALGLAHRPALEWISVEDAGPSGKILRVTSELGTFAAHLSADASAHLSRLLAGRSGSDGGDGLEGEWVR